MRLDQPAIESSKQGNTVFENFDIFAKTKDFPKTTKILKNIFVFDQQGLSMRKHIQLSTITQMNMAFIEHRYVCCV